MLAPDGMYSCRLSEAPWPRSYTAVALSCGKMLITLLSRNPFRAGRCFLLHARECLDEQTVTPEQVLEVSPCGASVGTVDQLPAEPVALGWSVSGGESAPESSARASQGLGALGDAR
jgi:hypothetical protein